MGFQKMIKGAVCTHQGWRNVILSIAKRGKQYGLRLNFRKTFIEQLGIKPTDKIDVFIGVDDDERKLMIVKGTTYKMQLLKNKNTLRVDIKSFDGIYQHSVRFEECPFVINAGALVIEINDSFYDYSSNKQFNKKHYHPILKPLQVRYMKAMCVDPEINSPLIKVPGFNEKMISGDLGNLKGKT